MNYFSPNINYFLISIASFAMCAFSIPRIILIAKRKKLFDLPDNNRKIHKDVVPNLGGVGIFFAAMIVASCFIADKANWWHFMVASALILFIIGIKDDILILTPAKKFMAQIVAASIMVVLGDVRLHSLHGILGVSEMPYWLSVSFSIVGSIFITNAFNLIDGIDGLAGSISFLALLALGISLATQGNINAAYFAFAILGAVAGFLIFNRSPARIFMGDAGALFIGFSISVLCIVFINSFTEMPVYSRVIHSTRGALIVTLAILFVPVFDSFRVFITRIAKGKSPFHADRTHLHHYLLDLGFSHNRVVTALLIANLMIISTALLVQDFNPNIAILALLGLSFILFGILYFRRRARLEEIEESLNNLKENKDSIFIAKPASETSKVSTKVPSASVMVNQ